MNWPVALVLGIGLGALLTYFVCRHLFQKRMAAMQKNTAALLARMDKLEKIRSTFVANVTHELKTPLTSIKGYVELLRDSPRDEEMRKSFCDIIDIEAERLHTLIEDILQLSEIEQSKDDLRQHRCDLSELGQDLLLRFRPRADKADICLVIDIPADMVVRGNRHRMDQMLSNLIDNAIKYNRPGGNVTVRAWKEGENVHIRVSDTGIGIDKEHHTRIFERFYRVDKGRSRTLGGTGLGLSIVKHVVFLHKGTIETESMSGEGTAFTVKLPD
ncbi:hypothetical protein LJC07_07065 [Christensenellaceae bacterium OttesenSCG-928-L17]|nr:hypothetical protein [Christensenellaceae bacterium OttesenSCG-928-L17]